MDVSLSDEKSLQAQLFWGHYNAEVPLPQKDIT